MALINCPECGKEISNQASNCPNCGFPVRQKIKEEQEKKTKEQEQTKKEEQEKIRKEALKKIKPVHIICIIVVIVLMVIIALFTTKNIAYNNAVKAFETANYKVAYEYFKNSSYKDSVDYREKTILKYTKALIEEKDFETADQMLSLVVDKTVHDELWKEMIYARAVEAYETGVFELSYKLLQNIKDYKDVETYKKNAEMMMNIQGEWNLSGTEVVFFGNNRDINYAALKIDGWNATLLYCIDETVTYEEAGSCRLNIINTAEASLKIGTTEYTITSNHSGDGELVLVALMINDDFLERFDVNYVWNNYGGRKKLSFSKMDDGIPKQPTIGMTAEEVRKSTWGEPEDINKSTYSWGVKEQWCYSDNRYIYLEDEIVTSISE